MSERSIPIEPVHLTGLIRNPVIVRIVGILDLASLSILELLEYNLDCETHEWDYYVKITEAWMSLKKIENSKPGDATKLPRNEKKECLMVVAGTKQGEVKRISYEIVTECPEEV